MILIPLFPLEAVLFPGQALPLHIFEPRYKEMIGEALAGKQPFGVVRALENGVAGVGCTAEITNVVKRYDDGRLDLVTEGRQRFEVMHLDQERPFLRGQVEFFADEAAPPPRDEVTRLLRLHTELMELLEVEAEAPEPGDPSLSFELAAALPFALDFKQSLLGLRSEAQRVQALIEYYDKVMPSVARAVKARKKAGGNGHAG